MGTLKGYRIDPLLVTLISNIKIELEKKINEPVTFVEASRALALKNMSIDYVKAIIDKKNRKQKSVVFMV